jgi:FtsH-binding integral membrane protein
MKARIAMTVYGFHANLVRVGIVMGFWCGVFSLYTSNPPIAVLIGWLVTAFTVALIVWDVRKARRQSNPDKGEHSP